MTAPNLQVIIPAGGKSPTMNSDKPDVLHEMLSRTLLDWSIVNALSLGPNRIIVSCEADCFDEIQEAVEDFDYRGDPIEVVTGDKQTGWAAVLEGAVDMCRGRGGYSLFMPARVPNMRINVLREFIDRLETSPQPLGVLTTEPAEKFEHNRLVVRDDDLNISGLAKDMSHEKPVSGHARLSENHERKVEVDTGFYLAPNEFLTNTYNCLVDGEDKEYGLNDVMRHAVEDFGVFAYSVDEYEICEPVYSRANLASVTTWRRMDINGHWMERGVTMMSPEQTTIEPNVEIGRDTFLYPNVCLLGETTIEEDVTIGPGAVIEDSWIESGTRIAPNSYIESLIQEG